MVKKKGPRHVHTPVCFSTKQRHTVLPLLNVLESLPADDRMIILAHLDDCSMHLLTILISQVIRNQHMHEIEKAWLQQELSPHKNSLRFLLDDKFKNKKKKKDHLIKIGGSPLSAILQTGIPLLLKLFR